MAVSQCDCSLSKLSELLEVCCLEELRNSWSLFSAFVPAVLWETFVLVGKSSGWREMSVAVHSPCLQGGNHYRRTDTARSDLDIQAVLHTLGGRDSGSWCRKVRGTLRLLDNVWSREAV